MTKNKRSRNHKIEPNAALFLTATNELLGIKDDIDPEENLISVQQMLVMSLAMQDHTNVTVYTFYTSEEMKSHFYGDWTSINGFKLPKFEYIVDSELSNPVVVINSSRISAINRLHNVMNEINKD